MSQPAFATLNEVKAFAAVTTDATDAVLNTLIANCSAFIRSYVCRDITSGAYETVRSGQDTTGLLLPQYPITAVSLLEIDGQAIPAAPAFGQAGYTFDDGMIALRGYRFTRGQLNIRVHYTAGLAEIPLDIAQACIELVTLKYRTRDKLEIQSKTLANETVTYSQRDMPASVKTTLNRHMRIAPL